MVNESSPLEDSRAHTAKKASRNPYATVYSKPGAARFSIAGAVARSPMSMVGLGIILMISMYAEEWGMGKEAYGLAGKVSAAYVIAQAICSPQLAKMVDRYGQAKIMRPAVVVSATSLSALVACTVTGQPIWTLYLFAILTGATIGSIGAMVRSRWSNAIDSPKELHTAFSLEAAIDEMIFVIGPIAATMLATSVAPHAGLIVPVVMMIVGGFWFLSLKSTEPPVVRYAKHDKVKSVLLNPAMLCLIAVFIFMGAIFGASDVATIAFAEEQGQKSMAGAILAVFALGSLISGLVYGARQWASPLWLRFAIGIIALAVLSSLFFIATNLWMLAGAMFIAGLAISPTLINGNNMVQLVVSPRQLTEGLTWVGTALGVGVSFGSSIAGSRIDAHGAHEGFLIVVVSAVASVVVVLAAAGVLRKKTTEHVTTIEEVDLTGSETLGIEEVSDKAKGQVAAQSQAEAESWEEAKGNDKSKVDTATKPEAEAESTTLGQDAEEPESESTTVP